MNKIPRLPAVLVALLLLALAACSNPPATATGGEAGPAHAGDANGEGEEGDADDGHGDDAAPADIEMDAAAMTAAGIRIERIDEGRPGEQLRAPGEVVDNAYGTTLITPRVEALVVRRFARLGDEVEAGAPLVRLSSVAVSDAQAELLVAEQEWRRVSALGREAVAGRRITEAKVARDRARARTRAYGLPGRASGSANGEFTLTAPHAGRITEDDFVDGERIEPGRALFRLVDESTVWVDAKLASATVDRVAVGSTATIVTGGGERLQGTVMRVGHRTSESTRSATVRIDVPNTGDHLHAGDFVDAYLDAGAGGGAVQVLAVPSAALVQLDGETVVFRRSAAGALAPVPVRTGDTIGDTTVILEGVQPGDEIAVDGVFALKARLLKSQLGEGHAH